MVKAEEKEHLVTVYWFRETPDDFSGLHIKPQKSKGNEKRSIDKCALA